MWINETAVVLLLLLFTRWLEGKEPRRGVCVASLFRFKDETRCLAHVCTYVYPPLAYFSWRRFL